MHGKGVCMVGGVHSRVCAWQGVCMTRGCAWKVGHGRQRGMHAGETNTEAAVRILGECILVYICYLSTY